MKHPASHSIACQRMTKTPKFISLIIFVSILKLFGCAEQTSKNGTITKTDTLNQQINESIETFKNRPIHKVLTTKTIDTTSDDDLLQVVFDNIVEKFPSDYKKEYQAVLGLTKPQQAIYIIWSLEAEVNNGGFNQFYFNSSGQYSDLIPDALKMVGALKFADLTTRANDIFKKENKKITKHQDGTLEGFSKSYEDNPLNKFDDEFYDLEKSENLQKLQVDFIRKNKAQFVDK